MFGWIAKYRRGITLAALLNFGNIWQGIKYIWDWAGRFDLVHTHMSDLHQVGGLIDFLINPPRWTVFPLIIVGVLVVLWDVRRPKALGNITAVKNRMAIFIGLSAACFLLGSGFGVAAYWQYKYPPPAAPAQQAPLYKAAAEEDFRMSGGISEFDETISFLPAVAGEVKLHGWIRSDLTSMAKYLVFYVPFAIDVPDMRFAGNSTIRPFRQTFETLKQMADRFSNLIKQADARGAAGLNDMGADNLRSSTDAPFTGAIYAYFEGNLTDDERVQLRKIYVDHGAHIFFRDHRYLKESRGLPR
jgi:hypothetical protein